MLCLLECKGNWGATFGGFLKLMIRYNCAEYFSLILCGYPSFVLEMHAYRHHDGQKEVNVTDVSVVMDVFTL